MTMNNIAWPTKKKCGRINGVPFNVVWKQCHKEAARYVKEHFPEIVAKGKEEKLEITEIFKKLSKKQQEMIENTKVLQ